MDQYAFVARSLFYLWLAFIFAAPVTILIAKPYMEHRRIRSMAAYAFTTVCWLLFFYLVLPGMIADWRLGGLFAAFLLALSPWLLSWIVLISLRPGNR